jgi:uncharacterized protein YjbJ (UPF0337 family)
MQPNALIIEVLYWSRPKKQSVNDRLGIKVRFLFNRMAILSGRLTEFRSLTRPDAMIRRKQMNPSTKDEIKGNFHEVKGTVKEKAGQVTNNPDLAADGKAEHNVGKVEKKIGQIEKVFEK